MSRFFEGLYSAGMPQCKHVEWLVPLWLLDNLNVAPAHFVCLFFKYSRLPVRLRANEVGELESFTLTQAGDFLAQALVHRKAQSK